MSFEEDDSVVLHDEHSDYDGEVGTVTQIVETMFGDANYTVSFDEGQENGVPEENLEAADDADVDDSDASDDSDGDDAASSEDGDEA